MVSCPVCATEYADGTAECPRDGARLGEPVAPMASVVPASTAAPAAAISVLPPPPAIDEAFDPLVGAALAGRYQIVRRIGEGGMGAVYEAKHIVIGKRVAVKVLLEKFHSNRELVARLLQEARLASSIGHENIVDVTDFGTTDDGRSFVVMEFLDGEPLAQLVMREAPLPVERSLRIARQVGQRAGRGAREGHLPPRREAGERLPGPARRRRLRQGRRLRYLQGRQAGRRGPGREPSPHAHGIAAGHALYMSPSRRAARMTSTTGSTSGRWA